MENTAHQLFITLNPLSLCLESVRMSHQKSVLKYAFYTALLEDYAFEARCTLFSNYQCIIRFAGSDGAPESSFLISPNADKIQGYV
jgi:hypothetical protein